MVVIGVKSFGCCTLQITSMAIGFHSKFHELLGQLITKRTFALFIQVVPFAPQVIGKFAMNLLTLFCDFKLGGGGRAECLDFKATSFSYLL